MIQILTFIGLKAIEISLVLFPPYYLGRWLSRRFGSPPHEGIIGCWMIGAWTIVMTIIFAVVAYFVIPANWELAGDIILSLEGE